ncbi:uncharacterized protein LOC131217663 isoform X1 [Magnolia sinica]|uniref:uncharacterized protein LOC131217663 isoform X1 n=1 Tax=Magnolia sinica TaxID=86752 RepID=UPI002659E569|nr:uncharacterized protein LOC131217663 isoform X1 [Magnolia sinica]
MGAPKQKWTSEEEEALLAGVNKHGAGKWRTIQKDPEFGHCLAARSNIDLKAKWRNMSVSASGQGSRERSKIPKLKALPGIPSSGAPTQDASPAAVVDPSKSLQDGKVPPRYNTMIIEALSTMQDPSGSEIGAISRFIEQRHEVPPNFRRLLSSKLRRLVGQDKIEKGISRSFQGGEARDRLSLVDHGGGQTGFVDRSALVNEMGGLPAPVNMMGGQPALFVTPPQILREVVQGGEKRVKRETYSSRFLVSPFTAPRAEQDEVSALDAGYMDPSRSLTLEELNLVKNAYDNEGLSWLRCLWRDESWVDDEGINLYMEFLTERRIKYPLQYPQNCLFVNTFFMRILEFDIKKIYEYGAGDHNNREDLGGKVLPRNMLSMVKGIHEGKHMWEYDCVYFPLNARERHWFLAVLYPRRRMLELYDSLHYEWEGKYDTFVKAFLEGVRWIFHIVDDGNSYWEDQWTVEMIMATPKQNNGYDCGVYVMKYIDFLCSRKSIDFGRDDIPKFRKTLSFDCLQMYRQYAVVPQSVVAKRESKDEVDIEEVKQLVGPEVEVLTKRKKLASKPITNRFLFRKRKKDV